MTSSPSNLRWTLHGQVPNAEVFNTYRSRPTDLFANTSLSEGIPVSIMEAQSCGIPILAPAVGGIPESGNSGQRLPATHFGHGGGCS